MNTTNLELSKSEYALIINSEFILTKNRIIEKVFMLFGAISEKYKSILNESANNLPVEVLMNAPKIYKGEQYKSLPYVMLDYPRCFSKTEIFAVRSFFWWGNYFSITLHLSGKYFERYKNVIFESIDELKSNKWFICVNTNEWEHGFENDNYVLIEDINDADLSNIKNKPFIKIAQKLSLEHWQDAASFFYQHFKKITEIISVG